MLMLDTNHASWHTARAATLAQATSWLAAYEEDPEKALATIFNYLGPVSRLSLADLKLDLGDQGSATGLPSATVTLASLGLGGTTK